MFNSLDQSHADKPAFMSPEIAIASLRAVETHLVHADEKSAFITLHGGEPTLWPLESFRRFLAEVARIRRDGIALNLSLQTNLWQRPKLELLELLINHHVGLGLSLDGPRRANDANRTDFAGRGSYDRILENVRWIIDAGFGSLLGGFLCVMQPAIDPEELLDWVASLPVTRINLLWPIEYNLEKKPWRDGDEHEYAINPRYGKWAEAVFDAWWRRDRPDLRIQLFVDAVEAELGGGRTTDMLGALSFGSLVINTDGAIELADYFRTAKNGGSWTGYSIPYDSFDTVTRDERFAKLRRAAETTPEACQSCTHLPFCRGGTLSGRLNASGEVTSERSVLCHDHMRLFDIIARRVEGERLAS